jgi:hypothetical protein
MRKIMTFFIALLFITSCAGIQTGKKEVETAPDYTGRWTGQSYFNAQGQSITDNLDLNLVHKDGIITGILNDSAGYMSNTLLINVELKEKTLTFSFIASTPMGNIEVNSTGTFSEDNKELGLTFVIPDMNISGNAKLKRS